MNRPFTSRETALVLGALRYWQEEVHHPQAHRDPVFQRINEDMLMDFGPPEMSSEDINNLIASITAHRLMLVHEPSTVQETGERGEPKREDIYARAARAMLGTPSKSDQYTRITITHESRDWLKGRLAMLKLDLLIEKKRLLLDRGADTSKHVMVLASIEEDLRHINALGDALS